MWLTALAMAALLALLLMPKVTHGADASWVMWMTREVAVFQEKSGSFDPYVDQLNLVVAALDRGDDVGVYAAMNRFMDMLENREYGIAAPVADWLFDYCNMVTPTKYHDISRHIRKIG